MKKMNTVVVMMMVASVALGDAVTPRLYAVDAASTHGDGAVIQFLGSDGRVVAETAATPAFDVDDVRIGYISSPLTYLELDHAGPVTPVLYDVPPKGIEVVSREADYAVPDDLGVMRWTANELASLDLLADAANRPHLIFEYARVVPEPQSLLLMGAAAGGLFFVRRVLLIA